jgi:hypothetical protein
VELTSSPGGIAPAEVQSLSRRTVSPIKASALFRRSFRSGTVVMVGRGKPSVAPESVTSGCEIRHRFFNRRLGTLPEDFLSRSRSRNPARIQKYLISENILQTQFLACRAILPSLRYLWPPCNCLWAFLCPLGAVLGIQLGRFSAVLLSRYCKVEGGAELDSQPQAKFKNATSNAQLKT